MSTEPDDLPSLTALGERLAEASSKRRESLTGRSARPAFFALLILATLVGLGFTAPGKAVTSALSDLVGGDVGGPPTQPSQVGAFDPASDQIVLAAGETADGSPFEIVAFRSERQIVAGDEGAVCVNIEFFAVRSGSEGSCYSGELRYGGVCCAGLTVSDRGSAVPRVEGEVRPGIARVAVTYVTTGGEEQTTDALIGMITPEFAKRLEVDNPSGKFIASIPDLAVSDDSFSADRPRFPQGPSHPIDISVFNEAGELVETETIRPAIHFERKAQGLENKRKRFDTFRGECRIEDAIRRDNPQCEELLPPSLPLDSENGREPQHSDQRTAQLDRRDLP